MSLLLRSRLRSTLPCSTGALVQFFGSSPEHPLPATATRIPARTGQAVAAGSAAAALGGPPKPAQHKAFCRKCGTALCLRIPSGEHEWRDVCPACGFIDYVNPKMVVGCIVEHEGKVLMCRRGIEPCRNRWTLPAGFLEMGESASAGAARETLEEACASVTSMTPFSHLDIPVIGQAYILFRAELAEPFTHSPGEESLETQLFDPESDLPFDEIAFSSIAVALQLYREDVRANRTRMHYGVINKRPGSHPADPSAFHLSDHICT